MKKVLVAGAALMLAGGMYASAASAAAVEPGVKLTGDFRARFWYQSEEYANKFGNVTKTTGYDNDSQVNLDSRARLNVTGTAAGGTYVKARFRMEGGTGDMDTDPTALDNGVATNNNSNLWIDMAYAGIPFSDKVTVEIGRYRSTYGPQAATYNFFYDDVSSHGAKGIIKVGNVEINPFIEYMEEAQNSTDTYSRSKDKYNDNDEMRLGVHAKGKINKDWTVGGMLGYQMDDRDEVWNTRHTTQYFDPNEGFFGSLYANGKSGAFGLTAELAVTSPELNNFNSWEADNGAWVMNSDGAWIASSATSDLIGSDDTGFGGYVFPTYTMDKLTLGVNAGFTSGGFQPDRAYGFIMMGTTDNSKISVLRIGDTGDWLWAGLVAQYAFSESLKLTGNLVYADVDAWDSTGINGEGPVTSAAALGSAYALDSAWELSAILQYTISKGTDVYFSAGYLKPEFERAAVHEDDAAFGALTRLEVKF